MSVSVFRKFDRSTNLLSVSHFYCRCVGERNWPFHEFIVGEPFLLSVCRSARLAIPSSYCWNVDAPEAPKILGIGTIFWRTLDKDCRCVGELLSVCR